MMLCLINTTWRAGGGVRAVVYIGTLQPDTRVLCWAVYLTPLLGGYIA